MIDLATASEVFCAGFSYSKSVTHPYLVGRRGPLLYMHDAPRKRDYRKVEFVAPEMPCEDVLEGVSAVRDELGEAAARWAICAIQPTSSVCPDTRDSYKSFGYRFLFTEPMMVASTADVPVLECSAFVSRVDDQAAADRLAKAAGNKPRPFAPGLSRAYIAELDGLPVGWVRSIETGEGMAWVAGMYVKTEFRRQGIAKALLSFMLRDDAEQGIHMSVLLASHTGALLYPALGYEQIGTLHLFTPRRD
ncbi:MAG TPA: GNAT family N-acetyltransferase [Fimbriimonas sp.]|nr:GNAT family N-acetyltransferase [Fimbriimonas sp.]